MEIVVAIISVLLGVIGVLTGVVTVKSKENKDLKQSNDQYDKALGAQQKITEAVNTAKPETTIKRESGTIIRSVIALCCLVGVTACGKPQAIMPQLFVFDTPQVNSAYTYNKVSDSYMFEYVAFKELMRYIELLEYNADKYKAQIMIYESFRQGVAHE